MFLSSSFAQQLTLFNSSPRIATIAIRNRHRTANTAKLSAVAAGENNGLEPIA